MRRRYRTPIYALKNPALLQRHRIIFYATTTAFPILHNDGNHHDKTTHAPCHNSSESSASCTIKSLTRGREGRGWCRRSRRPKHFYLDTCINTDTHAHVINGRRISDHYYPHTSATYSTCNETRRAQIYPSRVQVSSRNNNYRRPHLPTQR